MGSRNGTGSGADSVGSQNGAGSGADSVGSRNGAGSGANSVGSRNGAGSGADSVGSPTGVGSAVDFTLKAEPLKFRARLMLRLLWNPVRHLGSEGLTQASPEGDHEAGLFHSRLASHSHEIPGIILNSLVYLADIKKLPCWTHSCWLYSVTEG